MALVMLLTFDLPSPQANAANTTQSANDPSAKEQAESVGPGEAKPAEVSPQGDVKDTHERLARIYARLGIERDKAKAPEQRGCSSNRQQDTSKEKKPAGCGAPEKTGDQLNAPSPPMLPPALGYVLIGVVFAAMLLPLLLALRGRRDPIQTAAPDDHKEDRVEATPAMESWDVSFAQCRRLLAAGHLADALAGLHRLMLLSLEHSDALVLDATSTNWDYVRQLVGRPEDRSLLSKITIAAESAVLGKHPVDAARYEELEQLLQEREGGS